MADYYLKDQPIREGYRIYEERVDVAGIQFYKKPAGRFIQGSNKQLLLQRDQGNKHDCNALKIIGVTDGWLRKRKDLLGYVPREISAALAKMPSQQIIYPRLLKTYLSSTGYVEVIIQIIGRKEFYNEYLAAQ